MSDLRSTDRRRRRWVPAGVVAALVMMVLVALPANTASATSPCNGPNPPEWCTPGGPPPTCTAHNLTAPTIAGDIRVGKTATAGKGTWSGATEFSYQWQRDGADIAGATGLTYVIGLADNAHKLKVEVTAWSPLCDESVATSPQTGNVGLGDPPVGNGVSVTGVKKVGWPLTADKGTWTAPCTTPTYTYQWFRSGSAIAGATGMTRALTADDWDKVISVRVTASCPGYLAGVATSPTNVPPIADGDPLTVHQAATVTGTVKVGHELIVIPPVWVQDVPTTNTYSWYRDGVLIAGPSIYNSYVISAADAGAELSVRVTGQALHYGDGIVTIPLGKVQSKGKLVYFSRHKPTLENTPKVGHRLKLSLSHATLVKAFSPDATSLKYVWYRDSTVIAGATKNTYEMTKHDRHHKIRVRVYGVRAGYTTGGYLTHSVSVK